MKKYTPKGLHIAFTTYEGAKYACEHWHYSKTIPYGTIKYGVWEDGEFIGAIVYGRGASPHISKTYGLKQTEFVELVRVALKEHKTPVSRMIAITLRLLKTKYPNIKLVVSFADMDEGHTGAIYQAGNWIYTGVGVSCRKVFCIHGKKVPSRKYARLMMDKGYKYDIEWIRANVDKKAEVYMSKGKHRYFYALDTETRNTILKERKEYPKNMRVSSINRTPDEGGDGVSPIHTLHTETTSPTD